MTFIRSTAIRRAKSTSLVYPKAVAVAVLLGCWVVISVVLTLLWVAYRRYIGKHAPEEFDAASQIGSVTRHESHLKH